jgi:hypothetical protein
VERELRYFLLQSEPAAEFAEADPQTRQAKIGVEAGTLVDVAVICFL